MWRPISLFALVILSVSRLAAAQDYAALRLELSELARSTLQPDRAAADAARCRTCWEQIAQVPEPERPKWENTLLAVLAHGTMSPKSATGARDDARQVERLLASERYYRALKAELGDQTPDLQYLANRLLAVTLHRRGASMPPDERGPVMREATLLHAANAEYCQQQGRPAWEVCDLADLSYCQFVLRQQNEAIPIRERAITRYLTLPDRYLEVAALGDDEELAARLLEWQREAYRGQAATYLLHGLYHYNLSRDNPEGAGESLFLYAESLRVGMVHRDPTPISNVGALLAPGVGQETGRARTVTNLRHSLQFLAEPADNPYWRGRGELEGVDQAFRWLHARMRVPIGMFFADTGQLLVARHILGEAEVYARELDDAALLPLVRHAQAELLARSGLASDSLAKAREVLDSDAGRSQRIRTLTLMAEVTFQQGDMDRAVDYLRWGTDICQERNRDKPGSFTVHADDIPLWGELKRVEAELVLAHGLLGTHLRLLREASSIAALEDEEEAIRLELRRVLLEASAEGALYRPSPRLLAVLQTAPAAPILDLAARRGPTGKVQVPADWRDRANPQFASVATAPDSLTSQQIDWLRPRFLRSGDERQDPEDRVDRGRLAARIEQFADHYDVELWRGQLALAEGHLERAAEYYEAALTKSWQVAANALDPLLGVESGDAAGQLHHEAALVAIRRGEPLQALQILDMARHRGMLDVASTGRSVWQNLTPQQQAEAARLDAARTLAAQEVAELSRSGRLPRPLAAAQERLVAAEGAWEQFRSAMRTLYRVPPPPREPLTPEAIESLLANGEAMLVFSVGKLESFAILARRTGREVKLTSREIPILRSDLETLVQTLQLGCSAPGQPFQLLARELDRLLLEPFADELRDVRVLAVGPDDPLHSLPFAVLLDGEGEFLLERTALAVLPSLSLQHRNTQQPAQGDGGLLVDMQQFGDRVWLPSSYAGQLNAEQLALLLPQYRLSPLPHTQREGERLGALFGPRARRLNGPDAQEQDVIAAAAGKRYLHFATHGLVDAYNPFQSVLVLGQPVPGSAEDGFLEAAEILEAAAFSSAELVSLSACQSGLGLVQGTEGVLGLTWALLAGGNRAVVCSSWSIDDQATADFMVEFYRRLLEGQSKAESLRQAALVLRRQNATSHPAYWAAFQLVGEWK